MPIFFQQDIDVDTRLAVWKIEEEESFFLQSVMPQRNVSHPHKKLQHLAGRYLLKYLFSDFPVSLIQIADTRKPFLEDEAYHFSISHCGDYAAAIVSRTKRVGLDIELPTEKVVKILHKFLHAEEKTMIDDWHQILETRSTSNGWHLPTLLWSAKESMFKWWGRGEVDFSEMLRLSGACPIDEGNLEGRFLKETVSVNFPVCYKFLEPIILTWVKTDPDVF